MNELFNEFTDSNDSADDAVGADNAHTAFAEVSQWLQGSTADTALTNAIRADRLGTALLFYGPEGVGLWAAAIALAAFLNCQNRDSATALGGACGDCPACRQIAAHTFADLHLAFPMPSSKKEEEENELREEYLAQKRSEPFAIVSWNRQSGISIDRARAVRRSLSQKAAGGATRVVLFHEVEKMMPSAVDALLRMIEEPPPQTIFILTSSAPAAVAPTALSRCQRLRFPTFSLQRVEEFLRRRVDLAPARLSAAARLAQGSPGRALELAHEFSQEEAEQTSDREVSWLTFKAVFVESPAVAVDVLQRSIDLRSRAAVAELVRRWESYLRDLIFLNQGLEESVANADLTAELRRLAPLATAQESLFGLIEAFRRVKINLRRNVMAPLALADLCFALRAGLQPHNS